MTRKEKVLATFKELSEIFKGLQETEENNWYSSELKKLVALHRDPMGVGVAEYNSLRYSLDSAALGIILSIMQGEPND